MQKVARVNGPGKPKGKGQERNLAITKNWLMHMHQIKIFHICVSDLEEIYLSGKNCFLSKTKANLVSWQPNN